MPSYKFGNPYFYPTAADAGVSGEGSGFLWQQSANIRNDQDKGMVRLGKESDDVEIINDQTGEFEFPFDSGADYFALEVRQGHKSGGEEHGCEGSCYIFNVRIDTSPAKFFWQKQMWHGGPKHRHNSGEFGHTKVTEKVIGNGFKGFAAVIYTKKDGRSTGHNSAILEIWWNEDPVNNMKDGWFMVKRIEDKGGWGTGGNTCNGVSDQVITWSNIQFRYKSGTPDFSLHPRKPEFEDGPVIHSIGEEDMDFNASERRGYGYREDMPRDVEMICLFKFDSDNGKCRLKNLSLREINGGAGFDDSPDVPDTPQETKTISGKFKLQWDGNTIRESACAGAGAGGSGGSAVFYTIETIDDTRVLINNTAHNYRTRITEKCASTTTILKGEVVKQFDIPLKKVGSPSGNVVAKIWNSANSVVYTCPTTVSASGLSTSLVSTPYDFSTNTHALVVGDRIGVEYTDGTETDYVLAAVREADVIIGSNRSDYNDDTDTWGENTSSELCCVMWT